MWQHRHSAQTNVPADKLWGTFTAVHSGTITLPGGDRFQPDGALGVGTKIAVTPEGQDTMTSVITEYEPGKAYADETQFNGLILTFRHLFEPAGPQTKVTHELTITGEGADDAGPQIGPQISADFPAQMDALIAAARKA